MYLQNSMQLVMVVFTYNIWQKLYGKFVDTPIYKHNRRFKPSIFQKLPSGFWLVTHARSAPALASYWSVPSPRPPHPRYVTGAGRARSSASMIAEHCAILACKNNPDYRVSKKMFHLSQSWQQDFQEWKVNKNVYLVLFEERKYFCSIQQSTL